ncbi:MAG: ABC transporter ATP-binding protein [Halobacteriales archaeon]|nr:ABC transporter ATP-binding protein [Halobacteriales archaeon]
MSAIELHGVTKRFGDVVAVDALDLEIPEGEVFGFLGPNGAGKSTTINMLLDFVRPDAGSIRVLNRDAHEESVAIRQRTGVLPEGFDVYERLTGRQHIEFAIQSKEVEQDPDAVLERVGIADAADRKAGGYSTGMTQRLALGMALVGEPELLILDEPSTGLDPNGAREMREIVRAENDRGATVFFSSHILGQVEAVCDRVGILRDGEFVAQDSVEGLREAVGTESTLRIDVETVPDGILEELQVLSGVTSVEADGTSLTVACTDEAKTAVLTALEDADAGVRNFETEEASLEDLFVAYTEGDAESQPADGSDTTEETEEPA